jgi:UDP-N-acetyl-D-glucosamine dehydrogenase
MQSGKLVVVGVGYVGLPLAVLAQEKGWEVTGLDINQDKVNLINAGQSPIKDPALEAGLKKFPITATLDPAVVAEADAIVIAVPTPVTGTNQPDLQPLISAIENIRPHLKTGQLLIVESTINPGVMDEVVVPLLRQRSELALEGKDEALHLVHCPERINPGDKKWTVRNIPRVLGAYSPAAADQAKAFYDSVLEAPVTVMNTMTEAEAVKIMENTFRDINIAYVNEMAKSFAKLGIDIMNVIKGASTKPFAFLPHYPGNGVGGHCISVDPYYMIERAKQVGFTHHFLKLARKINDSMPVYTVSLMKTGIKEAGLTKKTAQIALLGLAYKKNVDDLRNSPAKVIKRLLEEGHYSFHIFDPYIARLSTVGSLEEALAGANVIMLATDHASFVEALTPERMKKLGIKLVIDGKNAFSPNAIKAAGIGYYGIGR